MLGQIRALADAAIAAYYRRIIAEKKSLVREQRVFGLGLRP
jgi:hypothetical protein